MWQNSRTRAIYGEMYAEDPDEDFVVMRKASTGKLSRVRRDHLTEYTPDGGLAFDDELPLATLSDPNAGEPAADPGEPDHVGVLEGAERSVASAEPVSDRRAILREMAQQGQRDGLHEATSEQLHLPRLPAIHGDLRSLTYNVGSAIAVLLENPGSEDALRVAILMLGDEVERLRP